MNKIYKVIFNKAKGVYEVVSELAHSHGKVQSSHLSKIAFSGLMILQLLFPIQQFTTF